MSRLAIGGGLVVIGTLGLAAFSWVRTKGLAVVLGPGDFGVYGQLATLASYAGAAASLGIGVGTMKLVAAGRERGDRAEVAMVVSTSVIVAGTAGLLLAGLVMVSAPILAPAMIGSHETGLVMLAAASIPFVALQAPLRQALQGFEDVWGQGGISVVYGAIFAALSIAGAVVWGTHGAVVALAAGNVVLVALYVGRSRGLVSSVDRPRGRRGVRLPRRGDTAKSLLAIGVAGLVLLVLGYGADLAVRTNVLHGSGKEAVGIWYALTLISIQFVAPLGAAISYMTAPMIVRAGTRGDLPEVQRVLDQSLVLALTTVVPAIALVLALRTALVPLLFTSDFEPMTKYMPIQLPGDAVGILAWILAASLVPLGYTRIWVAVGAASSIAFGVAGIALSSSFGVGGAAVAWSGQYLLELVTVAAFLVRRGLWRPSRTVLTTFGANALIFAGAAAAPNLVALGPLAVGVAILLATFIRRVGRREFVDRLKFRQSR